MLVPFLALLPIGIWIYLLFARGTFWRVSRQFAPMIISERQDSKRVVVVIPARDEAVNVGRTVRSLIRQSLQPAQIILVDDESSDGTAEFAQAAANESGAAGLLTVIPGRPLPGGWTGKLWALAQGVEKAAEHHPDFLLFTDADISHDRDSLRTLVGITEQQHFDLASFMVRLACRSPAEKALIPAFVFFFFLLYPPAWVSSARHRTAGAAGGCVLIRPKALQAAGGLSSIRSEIIDDCALARVVKRCGTRIWLGLTPDTLSTRSYTTWSEVGGMISRNAFNQLHHSGLLLFATLVGLAVTYLLPVALIFSGQLLPALAGVLAWTLMTICYLPFVRFYGRSPALALTLPAVATFYLGATIHSAVSYWRGRGGVWKGRIQDISQ